MSAIELVILAGVAAAAGWALWTFNRIIALNTRASNAWSDIDVQLKRRWDLVPRLAEVVRGYAAHEQDTLEDATRARAAASQSTSLAARAPAERELGLATHRLVLLAEAYPELEADELFARLHQELVETENAIESARRYYNAVVRDLNTLVEQFPAALVARLARRGRRPFFELARPGERDAPRLRDRLR